MRPLPPLPRTGAFETVAKPPSLNEAEMHKLLEPHVEKPFHTEVKQVEVVDQKGCCLFRCCKGEKNQVFLFKTFPSH